MKLVTTLTVLAGLATLAACSKGSTTTAATMTVPPEILAMNADHMYSAISARLNSAPYWAKISSINHGSFAAYYNSCGLGAYAPTKLDAIFATIGHFITASGINSGSISHEEATTAVGLLKSKVLAAPAAITPRELALAFKLLIFHYSAAAPSNGLALQSTDEDAPPPSQYGALVPMGAAGRDAAPPAPPENAPEPLPPPPPAPGALLPMTPPEEAPAQGQGPQQPGLISVNINGGGGSLGRPLGSGGDQ